MTEDRFNTKTRRSIGDLIEQARAQGWTVERTCGDHLRFRPADKTKPIVYTSSTPSDWRTRQNLKSDLRRAGLEI